jgi:succinoglycan biosynthesis protein ExoM
MSASSQTGQWIEPENVRVAICICTFKRPDLLRDLLGGMRCLKFRKVQEPQIQVIVVDNDECATAWEAGFSSRLPWPMRYAVEPRRGITYARNRAIAEAGEVDFIAFLDDDEVPAAEWLDELLWTYGNSGCDIVCGPALPKYAADVPQWIRNGGFFEPRSFVTGDERKQCFDWQSCIQMRSRIR